MEGLLIFSGTLSIIGGLLAIIEANLGCVSALWRKKGEPFNAA